MNTLAATLLTGLGLSLNFATQALAQEFSGSNAYTDMVDFCDLGPRYPGSPVHPIARDWLFSRLDTLGDVCYLQEFTHRVQKQHPRYAEVGPELELSNIICRFNPFESQRILLSAHWESRPFSDMEKDPELAKTPLTGANDSVSGVVILLELARLLQQSPTAFGVDLVFYDAEDWGEEGNSAEYLIGSRFFAENLPQPPPSLGINLDMVGDRDLQFQLEPNGLMAARSLSILVWSTARDLGYEHVFSNQIGPAILDDHVPLIEAGIPVIDIIDFDYPAWHTTRDTPDQCSEESLRITGEVIWAVLQGLSF